MTDKAICDACDWQGTTDQILCAANPFNQGEMIHGCPTCKTVEAFKEACDYEGCWAQTSIGTPTDNGYKRFCSQHGLPYITGTTSRRGSEHA